LAWLARRFGPEFVLPTINVLEHADSATYDQQPEAIERGLPVAERSHARVLDALAGKSGGLAGGTIAKLEGRHRAMGGNALRAAVLGANDGLVSNLSLVMGVTGAATEQRVVLLTGLAGLFAGACSMAMGEWLSVNSARELYEHQVANEAEELKQVPDEELEELALGRGRLVVLFVRRWRRRARIAALCDPWPSRDNQQRGGQRSCTRLCGSGNISVHGALCAVFRRAPDCYRRARRRHDFRNGNVGWSDAFRLKKHARNLLLKPSGVLWGLHMVFTQELLATLVASTAPAVCGASDGSKTRIAPSMAARAP
jgi:hypothetical protein